ncbi:MAG: MFS transporter, partial [Xanthobacteraceae bacterium]
MIVSTLSLADETSLSYPGWRIVAVCFVMATFSWGLGFYGQSVYLPELQRLHGWQTSWISTATTIYYLVGAALVVFVGDAIGKVGARACLIGGVLCMAIATALLGHINALWQLYAVYALLACGWAGSSLGAITNTLGLWFDRKRGMAISLALNGASCGGIVGVPLLTAAIAHWH